MAAASLHVVGDPERRCDLDRASTVIGRQTTPALGSLPVAVSREHLRVDAAAHGYTVVDLGSTNGTHLNGSRLGSEPHPIVDGDELVLGGAVSLRFSDLAATPLAPAIGRLFGIWIDPDTDAVWVDAQLVEPPLSARQFDLVRLLLAEEGTIVERARIIDTVWSDVAAEGVSAQALDALVKRTRARLRPFQIHGDYLENHRGRGLRIIEPPQR